MISRLRGTGWMAACLAVAGLVLAGLWSLHLALALQAQPQADDFCTNFRIARDGFWSLQAARRNGITGLYTGMALQGLVGLASVSSPGLGFTKAFAAALSLFTLALPASAFLLLRAALPAAPAVLQALMALAFFAVWALGAPALNETLFWTASATLHLSGGVLLTLLLAGEIRLWAGDGKWLPPAVLCCLLIPGASWSANLAALGVNALMVLGLLLRWLPRPRIGLWPFLLLLACSVAATVFALSAPGNANRQALEPGAGQLGWSLAVAGGAWLDFLGHWLGDFRLWLAALFAAALSVCYGQDRIARVPTILLALAVPALLLLAYTVIFLNYYGSGVLAGRTVTGLAYVWLLGLLLLSAIGLPRLPGLGPLLQRRSGPAMAILALSLAAGGATADRSGEIIHELRGPVQSYVAENQHRWRSILTAGSREVDVPALVSRPASLFVADLNPDPRHWVNTCAANYFKLERLCLAGTCGSGR